MKYKIPLELIAAKFAAAANYDAPKTRAALASHPRARELVLYLQAQSIEEGSLIAFVEKFIQQCAGLIGTPAMLRPHGKNACSAKDREAILKEIPSGNYYGEWDDSDRTTKESKWLAENLWRRVATTHINTCSPFDYPIRTERNQEYFDSLNHNAFQSLCAGFIKEFLPADIYKVCTQKDAWFGPTWYCQDLTASLIQMMDATAAAAAQSLAKTAVATAAFDALEFAIQKKTFVRLDGNARFGKSESIRTFAAMHPGKCRLITTDCMNTDKDFFGAIADALGIERDHKTTAHRLRMKIDYIALHCGLCFIWDEAHFLFPPVLTKSKRPTRLDWIRSHLVDRGSPVVIVTTPQIYDPAATRLHTVTGYNFDQWNGRIRRHVKLPEKISAADLLAIVQKKAPALSEDWQEEIAQSARLVPGSYLAAVNSIIDSAHWIASRAGRVKPSDTDLETAIAEAAPNAAQSQPEAQAEDRKAASSQRPVAVKRPRAIRPVSSRHSEASADLSRRNEAMADALTAPSRSITPATQPEPV